MNITKKLVTVAALVLLPLSIAFADVASDLQNGVSEQDAFLNEVESLMKEQGLSEDAARGKAQENFKAAIQQVKGVSAEQAASQVAIINTATQDTQFVAKVQALAAEAPQTIVTRVKTKLSATDAFKDSESLAETLADLAGTGTIAAFVENVITEFVENNPEVAQEFIEKVSEATGANAPQVLKDVVVKVIADSEVEVELPPSLYKPA